MKKPYDLSKFKEPTEKYLKPVEVLTKEKKVVDKKNDSPKKERSQRSEKGGRPTTFEEPLNERISLLVTKTELKQIKEKAGMIPKAGFIREALKKAGIIG